MTDEELYTVDATHTDPTQKETALCLKYRQRAREAESKLIACEKQLKIYRDRDKELEAILMPDKGETK